MVIRSTRHIIPLLLVLLFAACSSDNGGNEDKENDSNTNKNVVTTDKAVERLEFPKVKGGGSIVIVYRTDDNTSYDKDRVNFAVEWDTEKKAQRWSCYQMHQGYNGSYTRVTDGYNNDTHNLSRDTYWEQDYYYGSGYDHGHICPNADRTYSHDANYQTFYLTNMQPQYHKFNGYSSSGNDRGEGLWLRLEGKVRSWSPRAATDTLYVCKGGTIDKESNIIERIKGKLIVPKYFFMALLLKNSQGYRAIGFYMEQKNQWSTDVDLAEYAVTIDQLEQLTGIDFFCNLPDETENSIESKISLKVWGLQ